MKEVSIFTDGACSRNPGHGGWAAILIYKGIERVVHGGQEHTTNNRMELTAVIQGLSQLSEPCAVTIFSDSRYVVDSAQDRVPKWQANGWVNPRTNRPVPNTDLWQQLAEISSEHSITYKWVKGHSDNEYNNRCDVIAEQIAKSM